MPVAHRVKEKLIPSGNLRLPAEERDELRDRFDPAILVTMNPGKNPDLQVTTSVTGPEKTYLGSFAEVPSLLA